MVSAPILATLKQRAMRTTSGVEMTTLDELRRRLDGIDRELLQLVAERQVVSHEIARVKRSTGKPTRDYAREREVILAAREEAGQLKVSPEIAEALMRLLIRSSLTTQERASVAAQGTGSGRTALLIGGAGKMGGWFAAFMSRSEEHTSE